MAALHPEALNAAYAAYHAHAADAGRKGSGVEKAIAAYLDALEQGAPADEFGNGRFIGVGGVPMVSVRVAQSYPFAKALVHEWGLHDGRDHDWKLKHKALVLPAATYDAILDRVRLRLRPGAGQ